VAEVALPANAQTPRQDRVQPTIASGVCSGQLSGHGGRPRRQPAEQHWSSGGRSLKNVGLVVDQAPTRGCARETSGGGSGARSKAD